MGAAVGSLNVDLSLSSARFNRGVKDAKSELTGLEKHVDGVKKRISALSAGMLAGLGVGVIAGFSKSVLDFADDLATAADQVGINVERFQTLKESFRSLEVDATQFEQGMKRLTDTLGAVQGGTAAKGVVDVLDKMGITARITSGEIKTTDQFLDAIAKSAGKFKTEAEFTSAVVDILGRKIGVDFAAALRDGGKGLAELEQGVRDSGTVISEDLINRLADANESIDAFATASKRRLTIWAGDLIDLFARVGDNMAGIARMDPHRGDIGQRVTAISKVTNQARAQLVDLNDNRVEIPGNFLTRGYRQYSNEGAEQERNRLRGIIANGEKQIADLIARGRAEAQASQMPDKPSARPSTGTGTGKGRATGRTSTPKPAAYVPTPAEQRMAEYRDLPITLDFDKPLIDLERMDAITAKFRDGLTAASEVDLDNVLSVEALDNFERLTDGLTYAAEDALGALMGINDLTFNDVLKSLQAMIVQMTIIEPLARKIRDAMNSMGSGGKSKGGGLLGLLGSAASLFGGPAKLNMTSSFASLDGMVAGNIGSIPTGSFKDMEGFATGGSFKVGGRGGIDQNLIQFRATKGEMVDIRRPGNDNGGRVTIVPTPYFDAVVDGRAASVAAPIAQAGALGGAALAQQNMTRRARNQIPRSR